MNKFSKDTSIIYHGFGAHYYGGEMFYHVGYTDLRGNRKDVRLPLENMQPNYEDFLQQKALQHCKDYNEYITFCSLGDVVLAVKDKEPTTFTKTATYQKGDKFTLDGYTCVVTAVEKKRNFCIPYISYDTFPLDRCVHCKVQVEKEPLSVRGTIKEEYYLKPEEIPKLENYKTNEDWYDALMEVVNKK